MSHPAIRGIPGTALNQTVCLRMTQGIILASIKSVMFDEVDRHTVGMTAPLNYPAALERDVTSIPISNEVIRIPSPVRLENPTDSRWPQSDAR